MKIFIRTITFFGCCIFLIACGQSITPAASPVPSLTASAIVTITPLPTNTATPIITSTIQLENAPPTLIPTIDPTLLPELLNKAFSVQTMEGINGHTIRHITGWDHGFGGGFWEGSCPAYYWLDASHLLLYPAAGQTRAFDQWQGSNVVPQPVVINIESGHVWLPSVNNSASPLTCNHLDWSPELEIIITSEIHDTTSTVSTYTYDGRKQASFPGGIWAISPSGTKILIEESKLLDLKTNKTIELNWSLEDYHEEMISGLFWQYPDETRVYRCCYFYADLNTGISYRFESSDFQDKDGKHLDYDGLWLYRGEWVRNDSYFLVTWSYIDDGDIRYLPMLDPANKTYYDVRRMAGIPEDWTVFQYDVSWDGKYVWLTGDEGSYLINLFTFESRYFPELSYVDTDWSPNSQSLWLHLDEGIAQTHQYSEYSILSIVDNEIRALPAQPINDYVHWWHESDGILIYPSEDDKALLVLDAATMSVQKLPFRVKDGSGSLVWNSIGEEIAFIAEDGSIWQVDYPNFEHLEQLTPALPDIKALTWSPDSNSIAFISGPDIYLVDAAK